MNTVMIFLHSWGPWILFTLIPSILVAITKAPVPGSNPVASAAKKILQVGSVLTHKDDPGILKPPLVTSEMGKKLTGVPTSTNPTP